MRCQGYFLKIAPGTRVGNKARQIVGRTNISYPLIRAHVRVSGGKKCSFSENLAYFIFLKHPFWDLPFWLITDVVYL